MPEPDYNPSAVASAPTSSPSPQSRPSGLGSRSGRKMDADMYAGSSYAPTSGAGTSSAKQKFSAKATSTGGFAAAATANDDDGPGYGQLYSNTAMALTAAGATLKAPTQAVYDPMNLYSSQSMQEISTEINDYLRNTAVDDALREALNIPEVYQGAQTQEEPDPIVDTDKLKDALQPEPITVEELPDVIVKAGDTLTAIAEANGVPVQDVIDANPQIANPDMIRPGEVVKLSSRFDTKGETPSRDLPEVLSIPEAAAYMGKERATLIMKGINKLFGLVPPKTDIEKQAKSELEYFLDAQPESSLPDFFKYIPDKVQLAEYMKGRAERKKAAGVMNFSDRSALTNMDNLQLVDIEDETTTAADNVDFTFIKEREGYETDMYVPVDKQGTVLGKSGPTIASGFDLGQRNENDLKGLSKELVTKLKPYLGKKGAAAKKYVTDNELTLTDTEVEEINKFAKKQELDRLEDKWDKSSSTVKFKDLTKQQATVVASVAFQYGDLSKKTPTFWKHVTAGDWTKAEEELRNFGDKYPTRRGYEADYLAAD